MNNCESDKVKLWRVVQQTNNDLLTEYTRIYNELALILSDLVLCCDETNGSYNDILNRLDVLIQNLIDCCEAICDGLDEIIDIIITPFPESLIGYVVEWKDHICEEEDDRFPPESWEIEYEDHICQETETYPIEDTWTIEFEDYICEEVTDIGDAFIVEWEDHICQQEDDEGEWPLIGYELEYIDRVCQEDWECDVTGHLVDIVENEVVIGYGGQWIDYICVIEIEHVTTTTTETPATTTTTTTEVEWGCVDSIVYDNIDLYVGDKDPYPWSIAFSEDGTKLYVAGFSEDGIHQYALTTAWDLTTASFVQSKSVNAQETGLRGVTFSKDGYKMFISGTQGSDISAYTLSTAWDISTATYDNVVFSVAAQTNNPYGIRFGNNGLKLYVAGRTATVGLLEYTLSVAYDISTASYSGNSLTQEGRLINDVYIRDNGETLIVISTISTVIVWQYRLNTAWDLSSAELLCNFASVLGNTTMGLFVSSDGEKLYLCEYTNDTVRQYSFGIIE